MIDSLCLLVMCKDQLEDLQEIYRLFEGKVKQSVFVITSMNRWKEISDFCKLEFIDCFYFKWIDDYSAPLNAALRLIKTEWAFRLDTDERIDQENIHKLFLAMQLAEKDRRFGGFSVIQRGYLQDSRNEMGMKIEISSSSEARGYTHYVDDHPVRLFRNDPQIYWEFNTHEHLCWAIGRALYKVGKTSILLHHYGKINMKEKSQYYLKLQERRVQKYPEDQQSYFYLGSAYDFCGEVEKSRNAFQKSVDYHPLYWPGWVGLVLSTYKLGNDYRRIIYKAEELFGKDKVDTYLLPILLPLIGE